MAHVGASTALVLVLLLLLHRVLLMLWLRRLIRQHCGRTRTSLQLAADALQVVGFKSASVM